MKTRKIPEKYQPVPLVPGKLLLLLWVISLALPNLIYSGIMFADTLHILKWAVTGVPIAIALIIAGIRLIKYGSERLKFRLDLFSLIWLVILMYCGLMPFWVNIQSPTAYVLEMTCFVSIWAFYVISASSFPASGLRPVIILANLNASVNIIFAELQIRNLNNLSFFQGTMFADLIPFSTVILPTPGNYIGNTAQQNMFGLWCAVAVLGAVYLYVLDAQRKGETMRDIFVPVAFIASAVLILKFAVINASILLGLVALVLIIASFAVVRKLYSPFILILISWNFWGLMNSTSRSATIALILGLITLLIISSWKFGRISAVRFGASLLVLLTVFYVSLSSPRSGQIVDKTADIIRNAENIGQRRGIWMTSYAMFLEHPEGVGIGQYKWHYLEGQRAGFKRVHEDWYRWQYTHWAHNEFLQFFCEGGVIGGILLIVMWLAWLLPVIRGLFSRQKLTFSINSAWAVSLVTLITFCAIFTRPFHRIENMVWITLAFALSNREYYSERMQYEIMKQPVLRKIIASFFILSSIMGIGYIWSGIEGNYILRKALSTQDEKLQMYYLNEAEKHPIVREDALRNIGYHYIQVGEQTGDAETLVKGFNTLWEHFSREPRSEDISKLLNFAQRYQIEPVIREIASYFRPGDYHLKRVPQQDSSGRRINALLLLNGAGSDDE